MFKTCVSLRHTTMFTYSHANTPLSQSECVYNLSYFMKFIDSEPGGRGGGCVSSKIGQVAGFLKSLPYFRPKSVIFPTLFQT